MKFEVNICNSMRGLILLALLFPSCDNRTEKYYIRSEGLDGPRCKNFLFTDYTNFEIAQCVESKLYFLSPIRDLKKYESFFHRGVALIYIEDFSNFEILKNKDFMLQILENWNSENEILSIQLDDSLIVFHSMDNLYDFKDFKYKIK